MTVLNSGIGNYVISNGRKYSYFAGNNYLGLAGHPSVKEASVEAIKNYGVNFSASRHTTGTADIHLELEAELAAFKGRDDAVVFASGYLGNSILLDIMKGSYSAVFADQNAHSSILSAIPRGNTRLIHYSHCDADHLETLLQNNHNEQPLVITDGVFALTGETAPLDIIYKLVKRYGAKLVVDDAHATGVLGRNGRGTPEHYDLPPDADLYQSETMSKAIGAYGGFIAADRALTESIRERSAAYQASTALPPPVVAAAIAAIRIIRMQPELRQRLIATAGYIRKEVTLLGYQTTHFDTPIIPLIFKTAEKARGLSSFLEENGFIVPFMNYPSAMEIHQVRVAVSSSHTQEQAEELVHYLKKWINDNGKD